MPTYDPSGFRLSPGFDERGQIRLMARSGGYCMVRRPRAMPFVLSEKEWQRLSAEPLPQQQEG